MDISDNMLVITLIIFGLAGVLTGVDRLIYGLGGMNNKQKCSKMAKQGIAIITIFLMFMLWSIYSFVAQSWAFL